MFTGGTIWILTHGHLMLRLGDGARSLTDQKSDLERSNREYPAAKMELLIVCSENNAGLVMLLPCKERQCQMLVGSCARALVRLCGYIYIYTCIYIYIDIYVHFFVGTCICTCICI